MLQRVREPLAPAPNRREMARVTKEDLLEAIVQLRSATELSLGRVETKVDRLETKVDRLETKVDRLETKVDRLETRFDRLETRVENIATDVSEIKERLVRVELRS